jgi:MtaA/CmuA family methyltransferase
MNARERTEAMLKNQPVDRLPIHPLDMSFAARFAQIPFRQYATDHRKLVEGQLKLVEAFDFDVLQLTSDPVRETVDCGARVIWYEDQPPAPNPEDPLLVEPEDLANLRQPDPLGGGRMHEAIKGVALLKEKAGSDYPVLGWVEGPIAEAADLRGLNNILIDLLEEPEFVRDLFEFVLEMELKYAKEQVAAGADMIGIGDAAASLISGELYEEFVFPYEKRLVEGIKALGVPVRLHICGKIDQHLNKIGELGVDLLDVDHKTDLDKAREAVGPNVPLLGNIDPVGDLRDKDPKGVVEALRQCHQKVGNPYFVGAGCEIPEDAPYENVSALKTFAQEAAG